MKIPPWQACDGVMAPIACLALAGICANCYLWEGAGAALTFTLATSAGIIAAIVVLTRRFAFACAATAGLVALVEYVAWRKYLAWDMVLHAWDFVEIVTSPSILIGVWRDHRDETLVGLGMCAALAGVLAALFRAERRRVPRLASLVGFAVCGVVSGLAGAARPERDHLQYFWPDLHLANFYGSFHEVVEAAARGGMVEAGPRRNVEPFEKPAACAPAERPPHVLLIHEELIVEPDLFASLKYDMSVLPFFNSDDGKLHRLRVETYAGASWLTEFSIMAGASTRAFGSMKMFVTVFAAGKLGSALPRVLAGCGYRNLMFTPWDKAFMAAGRFFLSIGFDELVDRKAQGNTKDNERDRFFFENALKTIDEHVSRSRQPLFLFIETMSAHWPYDFTYMPEVDVPGGGEDTPPQMNEYLRRLAMVKMDDDWLRLELARRFPNEKFLIVRYGDHHPVSTLPYFGLPEDLPAQNAVFPDDSPAFTTFYAVNGVGFAPPPPPSFDILDVPYVGVVLLQAAGLPMPPDWSARARLMETCLGLFWTCRDRDSVLAFDRRLLDAGFLPAK